MTRAKAPDDQPDCMLMTDDGGKWEVFCTHCARTLTRTYASAPFARDRAVEHLVTSHDLRRVWIDQFRPGYRQVVAMALPLIVEHDLTLSSDYGRR